jgi:hypothetical protein
VKKVQRSFAVEYKDGRRKTGVKPNSIWGSMDLKSVARDVEESAMPLMPDGTMADRSTGDVSSPKMDRILPTLTPPEATSKTAADTQEIIMADDTDTIANADAPAIAETPVEPKKQRKPRANKAASDMAAADIAAEPAGGLDGISGQKKGRKTKIIEGAAVAKRAYVKRAPKADQPATIVSSAGDEMADLLQLEEENQRLRKLLAEKLRSENADLRKKLKLG